MTLLKDAPLIQTERIIHTDDAILTFRRKKQCVWQHPYNSRAHLYGESQALYRQRERALHRGHEQIEQSLYAVLYLLLFCRKCFPAISTQQAGERCSMSNRAVCSQQSCSYLLVRNKEQNFCGDSPLIERSKVFVAKERLSKRTEQNNSS